MKICTISFHSCPYSSLGGNGSGGMSVYLREMMACLVGFPDVKVDIFTRARNAACVGAKYVSPQIRVVQLKGGPERPVDRKDLYAFVPGFAENIQKYIHGHRESYDIVHSHYWLSGLVGASLKRDRGLPLVHTYHTLGFLKTKVSGEKEHPSRTASEGHLARVSDVIISPSCEEKESLIEEFGISPDKVEVISPGVNPRLFFPAGNARTPKKAGCRKSDLILLFVGRIEPLKGLKNVITALRMMKENSPSLFEKTKLMVVGGGQKDRELSANTEVSRIRKDISQYGLQDTVAFLGSIDQEKLHKYYSAAHALVVPSLYESFGLVTVEALACGTPVIVSRIDRLKSIVREGKNGFSFFPGDPVSLWQNLEKFYTRRNRLWSPTKIREDAIQRFSWESTAELTYRLFKGVIDMRRHSKTIFQPGGSPLPI